MAANNTASVLLSLIAVIASALTSYLSFFDARYEASAVIAKAPTQIQRSVFRSGDAPPDVNYQVVFAPTIILSNQGTRTAVLSDVALIRSEDPDACVADEAPIRPFIPFEPMILAPGMVQDLRLEFARPALTNDFETMSERWCFSFVMFDYDGMRMEPLLHAFDVSYAVVVEDDPQAPALTLELDYPRGPARLAAGGWLAALEEVFGR